MHKHWYALIQDALDQQILPEEQIQLEEHLKHCAECTQYQKQIQQTIQNLHNLPFLSIPSHIQLTISSPPQHDDHSKNNILSPLSQKTTDFWKKSYTVTKIAASLLLLLSLSSIFVIWFYYHNKSQPLSQMSFPAISQNDNNFPSNKGLGANEKPEASEAHTETYETHAETYENNAPAEQCQKPLYDTFSPSPEVLSESSTLEHIQQEKEQDDKTNISLTKPAGIPPPSPQATNSIPKPSNITVAPRQYMAQKQSTRPQLKTMPNPQVATNSNPQVATNSSPQVATNSSPQVATIKQPHISTVQQPLPQTAHTAEPHKNTPYKPKQQTENLPAMPLPAPSSAPTISLKTPVHPRAMSAQPRANSISSPDSIPSQIKTDVSTKFVPSNILANSNQIELKNIQPTNNRSIMAPNSIAKLSASQTEQWRTLRKTTLCPQGTFTANLSSKPTQAVNKLPAQLEVTVRSTNLHQDVAFWQSHFELQPQSAQILQDNGKFWLWYWQANLEPAEVKQLLLTSVQRWEWVQSQPANLPLKTNPQASQTKSPQPPKKSKSSQTKLVNFKILLGN